jgi:hypothetical protein
MNIYREEDIQAITDNLDQIIDESVNIRNKTLDPSITEYKEAIQVVKEFIKTKKRIVYGGNAFNNLINDKKPEDKIYKVDDRKDIEFYTPEPMLDLIELCNIFRDKKFPWIRGTEARHSETYTVFVNFEGICDMSYMPKNIYGNMPVIKLDGILYTHPSWILVDIFRQYNDPILSYWRLKDKTFFRANVLMKHYPLILDCKHSFKKNTEYSNFKEKIFKKISSMETIIFTGSIAIQYYLTLENKLQLNHMELFSLNFKEDIKIVYNYIKDILGDKAGEININMYRPFFQFWDDHIEFVLNGTCLLKIYGNNGICLPYNNLYINNDKIEKLQVGGFYKEIKGGFNTTIKIATFILTFNHLLINRQYQFINRSDTYKKYENLMKQLLDKRSSYFKKKSLNVMDNSPYREFVVRCSGKTVDSGRQYFLNMQDKKAQKKSWSFNYDPSTIKEGFIPPHVTYKNTSGNIYKNGPEKMLED